MRRRHLRAAELVPIDQAIIAGIKMRDHPVAPLQHPVEGAHPVHQAAFEALLSAESLPAAIEAAEPEVAELLTRLAVEEPVDDAAARVARLIHDAAVRELDRLTDRARRNDDMEAAATAAELKLAIDEVRASYWQLSSATQLLDWLAPVAEESQ